MAGERKKIVLDELSELARSGVIDGDSLRRAQEYYGVDHTDRMRRIFLLVVGGIASASIVAGVGALIVHFWDLLSAHFLYPVLGIASFAAVSLGVSAIKLRNSAHTVVRELLAFSSLLCVQLALIVASRLFVFTHLALTSADQLAWRTLWFQIMSIPLVILSNTISAGALYLYSLAWFYDAFVYYSTENQFLVVLYQCVTLVPLFVLGRYLWKKQLIRAVGWFMIPSLHLVLFTLSSSDFLYPRSANHVFPCKDLLVALTGVAVYLVGRYVPFSRRAWFSYSFETIGAAVITGWIVGEVYGRASVQKMIRHLTYFVEHDFSFNARIVPWILLYASVVIVLAVKLCTSKKERARYVYPLMAGVGFLVVLGAFVFIFVTKGVALRPISYFLIVLLNMVLLGAGAYRIWYGVVQKNMVTFNTGLALTIIFLIIRSAALDCGLVYRGIIWICIGVVLLVINVKMNHYLKHNT